MSHNRLCLHPLSRPSKLPFTQTYLFWRISKASKDIQGFKHELNSLNSQNCNTGYKNDFSKDADFSETSESNLFLARSNAESHSFCSLGSNV